MSVFDGAESSDLPTEALEDANLKATAAIAGVDPRRVPDTGVDADQTPDQLYELGLRRRAETEFFTAGDDPRVVELREKIQDLAVSLYKLKQGRCTNVALTHLTDVQMWANRGIFTKDPRG